MLQGSNVRPPYPAPAIAPLAMLTLARNQGGIVPPLTLARHLLRNERLSQQNPNSSRPPMHAIHGITNNEVGGLPFNHSTKGLVPATESFTAIAAPVKADA